MWASDKTWEIVLQYKYSDPVSPPQPQTTAAPFQRMHTNCCLEESLLAHVALMGLTWGMMSAIEREKAWSKRFLMFSVSSKQSKFSTALVRRLDHNRPAQRCRITAAWAAPVIYNLGQVCSTIERHKMNRTLKLMQWRNLNLMRKWKESANFKEKKLKIHSALTERLSVCKEYRTDLEV